MSVYKTIINYKEPNTIRVFLNLLLILIILYYSQLLKVSLISVDMLLILYNAR